MFKRSIEVIALTLASLIVMSHPAYAAVAFPGAEGSGRFATGGRGGTVYEVTNLANSGAGSIVDAVSQPNRTVVFRISGTIALGDVILRPQSNITIAGQTAPGDGICLKGRILLDGGVSNIIIRYIRVRVDAGAANSSGDAIDMARCSNVIIDHVTASYARDEGISCRETSNLVTVQWCIISEGLTFEGHSYGSLVRGDYGDRKSYHHNLYAHNWSRNPRPGNYTAAGTDPEGLYFDFRNNVIYNWKGDKPGYNDDTTSMSRYNFVGNTYIAGPESDSDSQAFKEKNTIAYAYWSGNAFGTSYASVSMPSDQWSLVRFDGFSTEQINAYKARSYEVQMEPVTTTSWQQALADVLAGAGTSFPLRDIIDNRIVNDVIYKTGRSIPDTSSQPEGAWPTLNSLPAPADGDHDGMPDDWETAHGLSLSDPADRNYYTLDCDYTNLEVYLNSLVSGTVEPDTTPPSPDPMTWASVPAAAGIDAITMTAIAANDASGVEYYFACTSGGGNNSGWQDSPSYTDTGLANNTSYTYQVLARDKSAAQNETAWSQEASATTLRWICTEAIVADLSGDCRVNIEDFAMFAADWEAGEGSGAPANLIADWLDVLVFVESWLDCNRNPAEECLY